MSLQTQPFTALAHITQDGIATQLGSERLLHPAYGTDAYGLRVSLTLTPHESELYREFVERHTGEVRWHVRSFMAQLGLDAFHPSSTSSRLQGDQLEIDTLLTNLNGEKGVRAIEMQRSLMQQGHEPRVMHAGLLPHAAKVCTAAVVRLLLASRKLAIAPDADVYGDGAIGLPPNEIVYRFRDEAWTEQSIAAMLLGQGRETLFSMRDEQDSLPVYLGPREFLVTGVKLETTNHHVVLRRTVVADGERTKIIHGESCVLHAGRTRAGWRQFEIFNTGNAPQLTETMRVVADLYRASVVADPGH